MKSFLRDNPTIAFGLGLPLLLVAVFLLISGIPALLVPAPQFEVLYLTGYNTYQQGLRIGVTEGKVQVNYQGNLLNYQNPRLWRYNPKSGGVTEINIVLPPGLLPPGSNTGNNSATQEANLKFTPIVVPDLATLTVAPSSVAPDGYEFSSNSGHSGRAFTGLFYPAYGMNSAALRKNGRSIRLPTPDGAYYGGSTQFVGWVVPR